MNRADYLVLFLALLGIADIWIQRASGKSLVEWVVPENKERRKIFQ